MIPKDCKRLAEVDFPIAEVSRHAAREKSIRHGHPSTLHLWWARRPLASSRAMLLALLWPDPCDPLCPPVFKAEARKRLREVGSCNPGTTDEDLRRALLKFIADFANWDNAAQRTYLEVSRALVKAAHAPAGGADGYEPPLVVDPFAGGGSIPLEALRLGCEAFASDLNPVACLILKVMLEDIPRQGPDLAEEVRRVGAEIKKQAEKDLADLYPKDPDGATPIAYLWARTVRCESPNCGAEIPLARSFWLCKKAKRRRALRHRVVRPAGAPPRIELEVFEPKAEKDMPGGTVTRAKATCVCCGAVLPPERVRAQLAAERGGADVVFDAEGRRTAGARMLAVVTLRPGETGRHYRLPTERDYAAVYKAQARVAKILDEWERGGKQVLCPVPDEPLPPIGTLGFRVQRYGMLEWGDLFTGRQKVALSSLGEQICSASVAESTKEVLALALDRVASRSSSLCLWRYHADQEKVEHIFGRQTLSVVWDFAEAVVTSESTGSFSDGIDVVAGCIDAVTRTFDRAGQVQQADACVLPLPAESAQVVFTDPPYYDAIPYSDLSDFFLVWLKRTLYGHRLLADPYDPSNPLSPKRQEAVQDETRTIEGKPKDRAFFETAMALAFDRAFTILHESGIGSVVFAHKTTEGWEALLSGLIGGGWTLTGSWPIVTEMPNRLRARESAALASSIHLVCRPRPRCAPVGDWADVLRELPKRVGDWMERLQGEGIRGADLVFACIGPALEIFSRYAKVETADGCEVELAEYLEKVWEVVGRTALRQILGTDSPGDFGEDARLTALFLWTLRTANGQSSTSVPNLGNGEGEREEDSMPEHADEEDTDNMQIPRGYVLSYDIVRRIAQPLGIHLDRWTRRLIEIEKGVVRLLPLFDRSAYLVEPGVADDLALLDSERRAKSKKQMDLFDQLEGAERGGKIAITRARIERETWSQLHLDSISTLDHVQKAMLLQKQGRTAALRELLFYEKHYRPDFLRLSNALSALYPKGSEEKRLLDAMLLAVPR